MNINYPVPQSANRSLLWLLAAALVLVSLFWVHQAIDKPVLVMLAQPAERSPEQVIPRAVPVPEPPPVPSAPLTLANATPAPSGAELIPAPHPVPTPPAGP
jgi:hypothetical protein